jgi:hypothetical protein
MVSEKLKKREKIEASDLEGGGKQYTHVMNVMGLERNFVFIYMRTQNSVSFGFRNVIEIGRDDSFECLRSLSDLYRSTIERRFFRSTDSKKGKAAATPQKHR